MRIGVAGGTGTVGRYVVEAAQECGYDVTILSRSHGVDVRSGQGLEVALSGVETIVDVTNSGTTEPHAAMKFFAEVAGQLQSAGAKHRVKQIVTLSIVGIDRAAGYGYYAAKLHQEEITLSGPVPATVLRATQFHEFAAQMLRWNRHGTLTRIANRRLQPVAARSVGRVLVELVGDAPRGLAAELAGPDEADLVALVAAFAQHFGIQTSIVADGAGENIPSDANLPSAGARLEGPTFRDWLITDDAARVAPVSAPGSGPALRGYGSDCNE